MNREDILIYDLIIIGTGPAGYSSAIYASRYGLKTLLIGQNAGGMAALAHQVDNYPGFISITGLELMKKFQQHTKALGVEIIHDLVKSVKKSQDIFKIITNNKSYQAKTIILALGTEKRKLNIPGEKEFLGRGVSYCTTCDGMFFKNKTVAVIGGGDSAFRAALHLAEIAKLVYLIYTQEVPNAMPNTQEMVDKLSHKIKTIPSNSITEIKGVNRVESVTLKKTYQNKSELVVDGVFVEIGAIPNSSLINNLGVKTTDKGYIEVNANQQTNIDGVFAAGDVTTNSAGFSQIITAASEGAIAALSSFKYLKRSK